MFTKKLIFLTFYTVKVRSDTVTIYNNLEYSEKFLHYFLKRSRFLDREECLVLLITVLAAAAAYAVLALCHCSLHILRRRQHYCGDWGNRGYFLSLPPCCHTLPTVLV